MKLINQNAKRKYHETDLGLTIIFSKQYCFVVVAAAAAAAFRLIAEFKWRKHDGWTCSPNKFA